MTEWGPGTLFGDTDHPWYVRPLNEQVGYDTGSISEREFDLIQTGIRPRGWLSHFIDLRDGRCVMYFTDSRITSIVLGGTPTPCRGELAESPNAENSGVAPGSVMHPTNLIVVAKSFQDLFERMLGAEGGYFFDEPGFVPEVPLYER